MDSDEDDKESLGKQTSSVHIRTHSSEEDVTEDVAVVVKQITYLPLDSPKKSRLSRSSSRKLSFLRIPNKDNMFPIENQTQETLLENLISETILDGYEAAEDSFESSNQIHSDDEDIEPNLEDVPEKSILRRINSRTKSFQLGRQLSCKWSTGAGPRIGCLRDYPTELQSHTLEQANLSPKSAPSNFKYTNKTFFSRNISGPYRTRSTPSQIGDVNDFF